jgi:hypothetical protein
VIFYKTPEICPNKMQQRLLISDRIKVEEKLNTITHCWKIFWGWFAAYNTSVMLHKQRILMNQ